MFKDITKELMRLKDKVKLLEEFNAAANEGYPKIKALMEKRDKLESEFNEEFDRISSEIRNISEQYGLPYGDTNAYMRDDHSGGQWAYIPANLEKWRDLGGEEVLAVVNEHDDLDGVSDWYFSEGMDLPYGDWVGSSC